MTKRVWALVFAAVLWGTTGTAAHFMPVGVSPLAVGASTMGIGGVILFAFSARSSVEAFGDAFARKWLIIGSIGAVAYPLAFYSGMNFAGVAVGNVVALGSGPIFAAILEWLVQRIRLSMRWALSTLVSLAGIMLLAVSGATDAAVGARAIVPGVLLALLAGFAYALYTYASSRAVAAGFSGRGVMGGVFGLGAIPLLIVLAATGQPLLQSSSSILLAVYLVVGPMAIAYLAFGFALRDIPSSAVTTITLLEPVVASVLAVLVVGERLPVIGWCGVLLILGGVAAVITARRDRNRDLQP